jgi:hypothetical protein
VLPRPFGRDFGIGISGGAEYTGFDNKPLGICIRKVSCSDGPLMTSTKFIWITDQSRHNRGGGWKIESWRCHSSG